MFKIDRPAYRKPILDTIVTVLLHGGAIVPERAKLASLSDERRRQAIQRELAASEKLENDLNARERKERAAKLGLVLGNFTYSPKETSN
jgi:hypothetical protein